MANRPNKDEIAQMVVANQMGESPTSIARKTGRSHHTVIKHLSEIDFSDPVLQDMIERIKGAELDELEALGGMARTVLFRYLSDVLDGIKQPNPIAITAILDRTTNMRLLALGKSTLNISLSEKLREIQEVLTSSERANQENLRLLETAPVQDTQVEEDSNEKDS